MGRTARRMRRNRRLGRSLSLHRPMRYLVLIPEQHKQYNHIYIALSYPEAPVKGAAEFRKHAKLMDKLEALGRKEERRGFVLEEGRTDDVVIALEDAEFEMVKRCVEAFPWNPGASRELVPLFDLLDNAPEKDPTPKDFPAEPKVDASEAG